MQALLIMLASGATKKGGGELKPEDLWPLRSDEKVGTTIDFTSEEYKEWYRNMKTKNNIK